MAAHTFKTGDKVRFMAGPRSTAHTVATVTGETRTGTGKGSGAFLTTKDAAGIERKVRPGACTAHA